MRFTIGFMGINISVYLFWYSEWGYDEDTLSIKIICFE